MKKYLFFAILISLSLVLFACASQTPAPETQPEETTAAVVEEPTEEPAEAAPAQPESDEIVIGFSGAPTLDEFQISLANGIKDEAEELGVKIIHVENDNDPVKQASDIEDLLSQNVDMLIITAANADAIVPSIEKANAMNVPVMMVDQGSNGGVFVSHNGNDNYCMGYRGMEYVINMIGGKGKVMHITGVPGTMIVNWNADAVKSIVSQYPDVTLVEQSFANWDAQEAQAKTEDVLTANPDLAGIYVHSECMTPGVLQALKAHDLIGKVKVVSGGFDTPSQEWLQDGEIQGAIQWDSYEGGRKTMKSAYEYLVNGTVPPEWNPWVTYINLEDGQKVPLDCPVPGWSPFTGQAEEPTEPESSEAQEDQLVFGFSGAPTLDEFQISLANGIKDEAEELGVKVIHVENDNDPVKQASDIEDLLSQNVDMLIITAAGADAIVPSIEKANEMNIPVMMVDQGANGGVFVSHNGNDNYCMGYRGMEYVINMIGGKGKVMHITGVPGTMIVNWNADAVKSIVSQYPDVTLVEQSFANWDAQEAQAKTEDVLTANPDLAGIYVHSECMTPGVLQALKAQDLIGKVVVVSGGFDTPSQEWLEAGEIQGAIQWDSYEGGRKTLKSAYEYLVNGTVPPEWNPWVTYINLEDGQKVALDCPVPGWSPFTSQ